MTVKDIIKKYLKDNGYDGLYNSGECACLVNELAPCDSADIFRCEAGYYVKCDHNPETCPLGGDPDCDWHIVREKPK